MFGSNNGRLGGGRIKSSVVSYFDQVQDQAWGFVDAKIRDGFPPARIEQYLNAELFRPLRGGYQTTHISKVCRVALYILHTAFPAECTCAIPQIEQTMQRALVERIVFARVLYQEARLLREERSRYFSQDQGIDEELAREMSSMISRLESAESRVEELESRYRDQEPIRGQIDESDTSTILSRSTRQPQRLLDDRPYKFSESSGSVSSRGTHKTHDSRSRPASPPSRRDDERSEVSRASSATTRPQAQSGVRFELDQRTNSHQSRNSELSRSQSRRLEDERSESSRASSATIRPQAKSSLRHKLDQARNPHYSRNSEVFQSQSLRREDERSVPNFSSASTVCPDDSISMQSEPIHHKQSINRHESEFSNSRSHRTDDSRSKYSQSTSASHLHRRDDARSMHSRPSTHSTTTTSQSSHRRSGHDHDVSSKSRDSRSSVIECGRNRSSRHQMPVPEHSFVTDSGRDGFSRQEMPVTKAWLEYQYPVNGSQTSHRDRRRR